jgi:hypothetical protein
MSRNILAGVEQLKIEKESSYTFDGRTAERIYATGITDGVAIGLELLVYQKNNCTFDITLIGVKNHFEEDRATFSRFLEGFSAP